MPRLSRPATGCALLLLLVAVLAGCGGGKSDAEKASEALSEGIAAHNAGQLDRARELYLEVLRLDPRNKFAYYNLGLISQTTGGMADAENHYRIALGIDPAFVAAQFNLAILKRDTGQYQEAVDLFRSVTTLEPENAAAYYNMGIVLRALGSAAEGDAAIGQARALNAQLPDPSPIATATPAQ